MSLGAPPPPEGLLHLGNRPPPLEEDPAIYNNGCLSACPMGRAEGPRCHNMDLGA